MDNTKNDLICPICGAPTRVYMGNARKDRLCATHANELKAGKITKCEDCGTWHNTDTNCTCKNVVYTELPREGFSNCLLCDIETNGYPFCRECYYKYSNKTLLDIVNFPEKKNEIINNDKIIKENSELYTPENNVITINESNKSKCITCGIKTDGLLFCSTCYHKYKNKDLLFKITNCSNVELLDESYEGHRTCKDGHVVKSKSEREIDNYLFDHGIYHAYERELSYGSSANETLRPDFCLPNYLGHGKDVYIEHWGYNENNIKYTNSKKFKMPIYKNLNITLVCTFEQTDMNNIESVLDRKLNKNFIKENEINFDE